MSNEANMVVDAELVKELEAQPETTILTAEEVISAFEVVYEELIVLRNSVINLHERLTKLETPPNESI